MRKLVYLLYVLSLLFLSQQASAQLEYRSIFGIQQSTLEQGQLYLSFTGNFANHLKIYDQNKGTYTTKPSTTVFNDVGLNSVVAYGLTSRLSLFTEIPLRSVHVYSLSPTLIGKGLGDISVGGGLNVLNDGNSSIVNTTFAVELPSGANTPAAKGEYALGLNAYQFLLSVDGYQHIGAFGLLYSAYYDLAGNQAALDNGDRTGVTLLLNRHAETSFGDFNFGGGIDAAYKFEDKMSGVAVPNSSDYAVRFLAGITYYYSPTLEFRVGVPYTIYQDDTWFTQYSVFLGMDFQFGL